MSGNQYDDPVFYEKYSQMSRSTQGLSGAGEWHEFQKAIPDLQGKRVLDLGCGYGWHCRYAIENGASHVLGIDASKKMLERATEMTSDPRIEYRHTTIEELEISPGTFDVVLSSLALHYVESYDDICQRIHRWLADGGTFVLSLEHPVFTAYGTQDWYYDSDNHRLHWPVDRYFEQGARDAIFLGEVVHKYHKTLTTYVNGLLHAGFQLTHLIEPQPDPALLATIEGMRDELRRPMMLILAARK